MEIKKDDPFMPTAAQMFTQTLINLQERVGIAMLFQTNKRQTQRTTKKF